MALGCPLTPHLKGQVTLNGAWDYPGHSAQPHFGGVLLHIFHDDGIPYSCPLEGEKFVLAHNYEGFTPWFSGPEVL